MKVFRVMGTLAVAVMAMAAVSYADSGASPAKPTESTRSFPLQLALVPQVQLVHQDNSVHGVRLNIWGNNQDVKGIDIGLMHETKGDFGGVAFGLASFVHGNARGLQFNGLYSGTEGDMSGLQVGMVNHSGNIHGLQIGLANFADDMTGIQIGLWNEIKSKDQWRVVPLINAAF